MNTITEKMVHEIEQIVERGNTAEIRMLKHEVLITEQKQVNRILAPVEFQE